MPNARVRLQKGATETANTLTDEQGGFRLVAISPGSYRLTTEASGFQATGREIAVADGDSQRFDVTLSGIVGQHDSVVITAKTVEPTVDLRYAEVFNRTLFTRDDQVMQQLNAGINAGQHEGGGKSLEIRRFGFNLDHGGVNGGLKDLVDRSPSLRTTVEASTASTLVVLCSGPINLTNRDYYETQNYFESRVAPDAPIIARIHATPAYPFTAVVGLTFRLHGK